MSEPVFAYLDRHDLLTLATATKDGVPHAAPMFYVTDGKAIYFSAADESRTGRNLKQNTASVAITVADSTRDASTATGVQIIGQSSELAGDDEQRIGRLFVEKYPSLGDGAFHTHYWRLDPTEIDFIHNDEDGDMEVQSLGVTWKVETSTT